MLRPFIFCRIGVCIYILGKIFVANSKILSNHPKNICITNHIIEAVFVYIKTLENIKPFLQ